MNKMIKIVVAAMVMLTGVGYLAAQTNDECLECHGDNSLTTMRGNKEVSLYVNDAHRLASVHKKVNCTGCHSGFDPYEVPHKDPMTPVNCLSCHSKALLKHEFHFNMVKANGMWGTPDVNCKGCHGTHAVEHPNGEGGKFSRPKVVDACGRCHGDVKDNFIHSAHAKAVAEGDPNAPTCLQCHNSNITRVTAGLDSLQLKLKQEKVCISCHLEKEDVSGKTVRGKKFIEAFDQSVHGAALRNGNVKAANCVDCHGSHEMNKSIVESSRVNKLHIQEVCKKCHAGIEEQYNQSIHAEAVQKGNKDAPVCTDCHGAHDILKHTDPRSPVAAKNVSQVVCGECHGSLKMNAKYDLPSDRFKTFSDSYHGLSVRGGSVEVVNCASCHGAHEIKKASDSTSSVSKSHLVETCGKCHPGASTRFTIGSVHSSTSSVQQDPWLYWVATLYIWLIVVVVGFMFIHNLLDLIKKIRHKLLIQQGLAIEPHYEHIMYERMTLNERIQHGTMALSFICLVLTGFMLRFPDAWWVEAIRGIYSHAFDYRSWIHRIAGIVMVCVSAYHVYYVVFTKRGRQLIRDLMIKPDDVAVLFRTIRYYVGLADEKPKVGRFSYVEKAEYWALIWGTIVMAITGVILWFETASMGLLSKLGWDIARTIHYYEAILATLAIVVWHFYFVIFNPEVYPMSLAWLTGKVSEQEMAEEHPLELESIRRAELKAGEEKTDETDKTT